MVDEFFMREALLEAEKARSLGEVPIGAVVVFRGEVIARAFNAREMLKDPTAHAEVLAIRKASALLGDWRLGGCTLYVTVEPCWMCAGAIALSRISRVVYGARDPKFGGARLLEEGLMGWRPQVVGGVLEKESSSLLSAFFASLRERRGGRAD